jgi:hypothetical protein
MPSYSFLDVQATLIGPGGAIPLGNSSGAAEEGIDVVMSEEKNTMTVGADGSVMHSLHAQKSGTVTVRLLKTSPINAALAAMYNLQTTSSANHGRNTLAITDLQRGDFISCQQVAFAKQPDLKYAKDGGINEWVFHAGTINELLGTGSSVAL